MKKMLFLPILLAGSIIANAQTNPNLIDFEPDPSGVLGCGPYAQNEGDPLDNNFFMCAYHITFHMSSLGGPEPIVAEVGAPTIAWVSGTTFSYNNPDCPQAASVSSDKPTNLKDIGCWMITDDDQGPAQNPEPLYVDYHDLECTKASGFLMDVDGTGTVQEGWSVTAHGVGGSVQTVYVLSPNFSAYTTPPTPQVNLIGGDGEASYWEVDLGTDPIDYIVFEYIGDPTRSVGLAFDEFAICSPQTQFEDVPTRGCCDNLDNENLIINGSFEAGNVGFTTGGYTYQGSFSSGSITEGMYSVVNSAEAQAVSNCWNILDHTYCEDDQGRFMVVNGRTHNPQYSIIYEQRTIEVEEGEEYMFCMYYQHLPQCSFDVFNPDNLYVSITEAELQENECESGDETCGWTKISYTVIPHSSTLNIQVLLNEGGIGDGNDVAFDDFTLRKKEAMPSAYCGFDVSTSTSGSNITLTANALTNPLPSGFNVTWNVTEANCSNWAPIGGTSMSYGSWNPYTTNFPGYCCVPGSGTPGQFSTSKCYIITRTVTNCCYKDCQYKYYLSAQPQGMVQSRNKGAEDDGDVQFYISTDLQNWEPLPVKADLSNALEGVKIYPNPGDGKVTISASQSLSGAHLTVYNAEGKVVMRKDLQKENNAAVDISALPNGAYSFKINTTDNQSISKTYIKQ